MWPSHFWTYTYIWASTGKDLQSFLLYVTFIQQLLSIMHMQIKRLTGREKVILACLIVHVWAKWNGVSERQDECVTWRCENTAWRWEIRVKLMVKGWRDVSGWQVRESSRGLVGYSLCMHSPSVQFLDCSTMPSQSFPPFLGAGALHSLLLQWVHSVPQVDHLLHSVHRPSTTTQQTGRTRVEWMKLQMRRWRQWRVREWASGYVIRDMWERNTRKGGGTNRAKYANAEF